MPLRTMLQIAMLALAGLPSLAVAEEILTIHDLAVDPERYDGKQVTVRAIADFNGINTMMLLHSKKEYVLYNKGAMKNVEAARACITMNNNDKLFTSAREKKAIQGRIVTVRGLFEANLFGKGGEGINFSGCDVNTRLLTVEHVLRVED